MDIILEDARAPLRPCETDIALHLDALFGEMEGVGHFEIRCLHRDGNRQHSRWFESDDIVSATAHVVASNTEGWNTYITTNPLRHGWPQFGKASRDEDVVAARVVFLDADGMPLEGLLDKIRDSGLTPSFAVITGTAPSLRVHIYFALDEMTLDLAVWQDIQHRVAVHFGTDVVVRNPARIMRVGGSVSYPTDKKLARRYVPEVTQFMAGNAAATVSLATLRDMLPPVPAPALLKVVEAQPWHDGNPMPLEVVRAALDVIPAIAGRGQHNTHLEIAVATKAANAGAYGLFEEWQRRSGSYRPEHRNRWTKCPVPDAQSYLGLLKHAKRANPDWWRGNAEAEEWMRDFAKRKENLETDALDRWNNKLIWELRNSKKKG